MGIKQKKPMACICDGNISVLYAFKRWWSSKFAVASEINFPRKLLRIQTAVSTEENIQTIKESVRTIIQYTLLLKFCGFGWDFLFCSCQSGERGLFQQITALLHQPSKENCEPLSSEMDRYIKATWWFEHFHHNLISVVDNCTEKATH